MATGSGRRSRLDAPRSASPQRSATPRRRKGALLIPAFAVERTQELIVDLVGLMERGEIPAAPIFLDSPLAIRATEVFRKHAASLDPEIDVRTAAEFAATPVHRNRGREQGDCETHRLPHHHRRQRHVRRRPHPAPSQALAMERPGHGAAGRLSAARNARPISVDGAKAVRIQGDEIKVAARIRMIDDYSGHADGSELARWIAARRPIERGVFLVHGEEQAIAGLAERVAERVIPAAMLFQPVLDDVYELSAPAPTLDRRIPSPSAHAPGGDRSGLAQ